ncbi:MAG: amidohydrolase family protein [Gemmatimonadota bacterium]
MTTISILRTVLVLATLQWSALPARAQTGAQPPLEIFHGFTLIDGQGGPPIPDAAISVRGNQIVTVGSRRELLSGPSAPRDAIVINLGGGYVVPGLIDAHVHLATSPNRANAEAELHRLLYGGVTAVRDMAGDARALASLARDSRLGVIEAPDVYFAALMAGPPFFADPRPGLSAAGELPGDVPWIQAITPTTDMVRAVAMAKGTYATGVKIHADLEQAEVRRIADEAHRQGMQVWAHSMVFPARPLEVIESGVDVISHACDIGWEAMASAPTRYHNDVTPQYSAFEPGSRVFTALFEEMRRRGTILDATLAIYARADSLRETDPETAPGARCDVGFVRALVAQAKASGVRIAAGSDFTTPPENPFPALHAELEELVTYGGLTPMDAILAATSVAAETFGMEATHGTLAHGRPVNFVFLRQDPLADIRNLRSVQAVWKNAVRHDRTAFRSRFPTQQSGTRTTVANTAPAPIASTETPRALLDSWLAMWGRYDLAPLRELFIASDALTYFPSDRQELISGFDDVRNYHADLGFVVGGFQPESELWLEGVTISDFEESAVIGAVWYFGSRVNPAAAGRGPLTMVLTRTSAGYRISHINFGNYPTAR